MAESKIGKFAEQYKYINADYEGQRKDILKNISNVELRQQEIQNYITDIDTNIQTIRGMLVGEKDREKSRMLRGALSTNIELLMKMYSVYREYEDVKVKYVKENSTVINSKHRILEIDIRRIDEKIEGSDNDFADVMRQTMLMFSKFGEKQSQAGTRVAISEDVQNQMISEDKAYEL